MISPPPPATPSTGWRDKWAEKPTRSWSAAAAPIPAGSTRPDFDQRDAFAISPFINSRTRVHGAWGIDVICWTWTSSRSWLTINITVTLKEVDRAAKYPRQIKQYPNYSALLVGWNLPNLFFCCCQMTSTGFSIQIWESAAVRVKMWWF